MLTQHVMTKDVVTAAKETSIQECIELLFKRHVGSIIIANNSKQCLGIFTERDAIRLVAQKVPLDTEIGKVMTKNIFTIREDATFEEAKSIINTHGIRHLPVIDSNGKLVGLISVRHILNEFFGM